MPGVRKLKNVHPPLVCDEGDGYLDDFPSGPLDAYRKMASFDWKQMRLTIENEKQLKLKVNRVFFDGLRKKCTNLVRDSLNLMAYFFVETDSTKFGKHWRKTHCLHILQLS